MGNGLEFEEIRIDVRNEIIEYIHLRIVYDECMTRIYFLPKLEITISENFEKLIKHKLNKKMFDEILGTENFPFSNYAVTKQFSYTLLFFMS